MLASSSPSLTATNPIPVSLTFSHAVSGLVMGDVAVSNGSVTAFSGSGSTYTVAITPNAPGVVTINLAAGVAIDAAGNANLAASPLSFTYTTTGPTVTSNVAATQANPTSTPSVAFAVVFSRPITGFASKSVVIGGTAPGTLRAALAASDGTGADYTVTITGMTGSGTVTASIPADQVIDSNGLPNVASTSTDNQVTYNDPVTAGSAAVSSASSSSSSKCGSGLNAAIVPLLLLGLWRHQGRCPLLAGALQGHAGRWTQLRHAPLMIQAHCTRPSASFSPSTCR
jgi:hypothetical protein